MSNLSNNCAPSAWEGDASSVGPDASAAVLVTTTAFLRLLLLVLPITPRCAGSLCGPACGPVAMATARRRLNSGTGARPEVVRPLA